MMACGHSANAVSNDQPCCAICLISGSNNATTIIEPPDLSHRQAQCSYGAHAIVSSSLDLAFFEHRPEQEKDIYYCGCMGWD